jgi:hypothetical protein
MPTSSPTHPTADSEESRRRLIRGVLVALPASLLVWAALLTPLAVIVW